ncbi:hypothetical protein L2Y94_17985 [Luteibacter aegosomatis]|uniref:DUF7009 family protein n=1 Tax=Luteibacter aegosomatis TaxID=2911537 RepID=UPI001FFA2DDE|nr:hypothetical protein [Luteibacter aegosomatis]UPG85178.1 hypothetical protein L2Y94_17985 [Luteibacter aegosomatis]
MRVQLENDTIRIRVDEDELAELLGDVALLGSTAFGRAFTMRYAIDATDGEVSLDGSAHEWRLEVPRAQLLELKSRLPSKDGLVFEISGNNTAATRVLFDVDVKDSLRRRKS